MSIGRSMNGATFSGDDRRFRYALWRRWKHCPKNLDALLFIGLNPSTANATKDDPTIRRCVGFSQRWGYERLTVANLFALRATDPTELLKADDPVGSDNDWWLGHLVAEVHDRVVAAWGGTCDNDRARDVTELLAGHIDVHCLGTTKSGQPRHPLYLASSTELELFRSTR